MHPSASWRGQLKQHSAVFGSVLIHQFMTHDGRQQDLQPGEISCSEQGAHRTNAGSGACLRMTGDAPVSGKQILQPGLQAVMGNLLAVKASYRSTLAVEGSIICSHGRVKQICAGQGYGDK